ncbi:MAG: hypothetical protein II884_05835 [Synergistaceae bacterium]|nr:hypothetical protein [Synergistaceae bacterium]MBQ3694274.1 hypothetical protein [Synergistaceae bacterium]
MQRRIKRRRPQKKRYDFLRGVKKVAAFLYWFASFVLVLLEIGTIIKNW